MSAGAPAALIAFSRIEPTSMVPTCAMKHKDGIGGMPSRSR